MPSPNWTDDDQLMRELTAALRVPEVDEQILAAARGAFAWRTVDMDLELIGLLDDSTLHDEAAVRDSATEAPRTLSFHGEHLGVEIELHDAGIEGQLIPAQPGTVTLVTPAGPHASVSADAVGCFSLPASPGGPVRLECATEQGRFVTVWITI